MALHDDAADRRLESDEVVLVGQVAVETRDVGDLVVFADGEGGDAVGEASGELHVEFVQWDHLDPRFGQSTRAEHRARRRE